MVCKIFKIDVLLDTFVKGFSKDFRNTIQAEPKKKTCEVIPFF